MGLLTGGAKAGKKAARLIKNSDAVKTLSDAYYGGKNANNPHARFVDLSKGDDYALIEDYPIDSLAKHWDDRPNGIVDSTTRQAHVDEIKNMGNLPPIKLARNGHLSDGGHRVAAAVQRGETTIPALIRKPDAEKLGYEVGEAKNLLDMATEARMKRAAEQGYGPETYYHGTSGDYDELIPSESGLFGGGIYTTKRKEQARKYGDIVKELHVRSDKPINGSGTISKADADKISKELDGFLVDTYKSPYENWQHIKNNFGADKAKSAFENAGFDSLEHKAYKIPFNSNQVRDVKAAFDPSKRNSANLLAGAAGTAGVGLLGAGASNKGYAAPPTANDIFAQYGNEQQIQPAKHPKLAQAAGLLQGVETPLDGLLGAGWATEGVTGLLDKLSYGDKRKYSDYVKAALDFF